MAFSCVSYIKNEMLHKYYSFITIRLKVLTFYEKKIKLRCDLKSKIGNYYE